MSLQRRSPVCHDDRMEQGGRPSDGGWQSRVLTERFGRLRVGLLIAIASFWIVAPNIPSSAIRDEVDWLWEPAEEMGLVQDWAVFSPNPRSQSIDVRARIEFDDGSIDFWDVPEFDPTIGALRSYRWHKWQERIRLNNREFRWPAAAEWIAHQYERDGRLPRRVTMIRRWIDHDPLIAGAPAPDSGWNEFEFFVWEREL